MEADEYRRMAEVEDVHWWYIATRQLLAQELGPYLVQGGRFLDAGGGTGATGAWLADRGELVATDFVPLALDAYRTLHPRVGQFVAADVQRQPFADGSFDAALCVTVLCHQSIPDPVVAVRELARVVRPGGVVCLWEPGVRRLRRAHDRVTHSARRFSLARPARRGDASRSGDRAGDGRVLVPRAAGRREGVDGTRPFEQRPRPSRGRTGRRARPSRLGRAPPAPACRAAGRVVRDGRRPPPLTAAQ